MEILVDKSLDEILHNLSKLISAENKAAVDALQGKIEAAINEAGNQLKLKLSSMLPSDYENVGINEADEAKRAAEQIIDKPR